MIKFDVEFDSIILATKVQVQVYLPNKLNTLVQVTDYKEHYSFKPFKTLFLLHGAWDNGQQWIENTSITRMAQDAGVALVIPSMGNHFYANTVNGEHYYDFFAEELMGFVRGLFPLSERREDNFICGVSMGGYGTLEMVFTHPETYARAAVMSAGVDASYACRFTRQLGINCDGILGPWKDVRGSRYDLRVMLRSAEDYRKLPELLIIDSFDDYFYRQNQEFKTFLEQEQVSFEYREYEGQHDWYFWDAHMKEVLDWLTEEQH